VIFSGFVARAQCLHEAATQMIDAENPHAAFTLLRAYAENTATILRHCHRYRIAQGS
jgi:hypothetical protein